MDDYNLVGTHGQWRWSGPGLVLVSRDAEGTRITACPLTLQGRLTYSRHATTSRGLDLLVGRRRVQMEVSEAIVVESLVGQVAMRNGEPPLGKS